MTRPTPSPAHETGHNAPGAYTVSEISRLLKQTIEERFGAIRVRGEIGRVTRAASGHVYLDLKDERAVLSAVIWRDRAQALTIQPEQGLEMICAGRLTAYPGQSRYQLVIEEIAPAGKGALMALLEARRKALHAEGLFDPARKRPLPFLPDTIGVVTSPSGAVIRDILHRISARFPRRVVVWPVRVQGGLCAQEVAAAIQGFQAPPVRPDLLIVARGGGSLEDLWGFNEEIVVRAAAASAIPVISAVGHETDHTLLDEAADARAPTPSAAAEMAVPVRREMAAAILDLARRQIRAGGQMIATRRVALARLVRAVARGREALDFAAQRFDSAAGRLPPALRKSCEVWQARLSGLTRLLSASLLAARREEAGRRLAGLAARLRQGWTSVAARRGQRLQGAARLLESLGYARVLERGFALVRDSGGMTVRRAGQTRAGQRLDIEFVGRERIAVCVESPARARPAGRAKAVGRQKRLL